MKKNVKVEREYEIKGDEKILICEYKYDNKDNMIYYKDFDGEEYYWEYKYDDKGNKIYEKYPNGYEYHWEYKYDDKGNVIYKKDKLVMNIIWNMNINVMNYLFSSF